MTDYPNRFNFCLKTRCSDIIFFIIKTKLDFLCFAQKLDQFRVSVKSMYCLGNYCNAPLIKPELSQASTHKPYNPNFFCR